MFPVMSNHVLVNILKDMIRHHWTHQIRPSRYSQGHDQTSLDTSDQTFKIFTRTWSDICPVMSNHILVNILKVWSDVFSDVWSCPCEYLEGLIWCVQVNKYAVEFLFVIITCQFTKLSYTDFNFLIFDTLLLSFCLSHSDFHAVQILALFKWLHIMLTFLSSYLSTSLFYWGHLKADCMVLVLKIMLKPLDV
jgi:hypothetical protein